MDTLGLSLGQVRAWTRCGLLAPERDASGAHRYSFQDVALLREARGLLDEDIPARKIRAAVRALRSQLPPGQPLSAVRIEVAGERVLARDAEHVWEPTSGQLFFDWASEKPVMAAPAGVITTSRPDTDPGQARSADDWYHEALDLENTSPAEAQAAYRRALDLDTGHADAHQNLGRLLHEAGQLTEAEEHYREACAHDAESALARYNLGVVLEDQRRPAEAVSAYRAALVLDEALAAAHFNLARLCEARGEDAEALAHLAAYKKLSQALADD